LVGECITHTHTHTHTQTHRHACIHTHMHDTTLIRTLIRTYIWAGLIYAAILLPMDMMAFYFDVFAYDTGDLFWIEISIAMILNCET
jgi:hypothetical protein